MANYKIISLDLDGTLLNSEQHVSEENNKAIEALVKKGVLFVPNSGRALNEMPNVIRNHPHARYIIYSDGAVIYDRERNTRDTAFIDADKCRAVWDILTDYEHFAIVHRDETAFAEAKKSTVECMNYHNVGLGFQEMIFEKNVLIDGLVADCHDRDDLEMICAFFKNDADLEACSARVKALGGLMIVSSFAHNIEIISDRAGKGKALRRLADMVGASYDETIAVGDSSNDAELLHAAGLGLAMKNAWDELKQIADEVVDCTNDEHIAKYLLENYFN
ncbi:MAG: HAD family phosphatase [Clostridia bacterium]|nr:HAD family phosphatase [Clostridia bacterium]